jgi:hypothetical protein
MKIKYTAGYSTQDIRLSDISNDVYRFEKNIWKEVPDHIANRLLRSPIFVSENDWIFDPDYMKTSNKDIAINRFGALGDLIMLLPVIRYLKRTTNNRFHLITQQHHVKTFSREKKTFTSVVHNTTAKKEKYDRILYLDGVLECDHSSKNEERHIHRVKLYERFFGITVDNYDFSLEIDDSDIRFAKGLLNACRK